MARSKIEYLSLKVGPRDEEHRRVAQLTEKTIAADEQYVDSALAALAAAIEALGGSVSLPPRNPSTPPFGGQIGG